MQTLGGTAEFKHFSYGYGIIRLHGIHQMKELHATTLKTRLVSRGMGILGT